MGSPESRYMRRGRLSRGLGRRLSGTGVSVGLEVGAMVGVEVGASVGLKQGELLGLTTPSFIWSAFAACFGSLRAVTAS